MGNILQRSLKIRVFAIFFLVAALAVSVLGLITFFSGRSILQEQIENSLTAASQNKEIALVGLMKRDKVVYFLLDRDRWLAEATDKVVNHDSNSKQIVSEACLYLEEFRKQIPNVDEIFIMDMTGKVIISSRQEDVGINKSDDTYFTEGKKELTYKSVYISKATNMPCWGISGPFLSLDRNKVIGVMGLRYAVAGLETVMTERAGLGQTGESYLVNSDGMMISASRFHKDVFLKEKVDTEPVRLFRQSGKPMTGIYRDYRNELVLGASMGDDITKEAPLGWVLLSEIDIAEAFAPINKLGLIIIILGAIISVMVGFVAFLIARSIANPISDVALATKKVAEGDLTVSVKVKGEDEISVMGNAFNATVATLRNMVMQILSAAERISASSQELSSSAEEMNATTEEVSSTVQEIAKGTETQATKVEETQKVMEEMAASVVQVSKSAQDAASQGTKAADAAQKGGEAVKLTQDKISEVYETIIISNETIKKLGQRSDQIGEIVSVITNIADQTNLLALNAAIEAARAGEYGRGFAVVAEEVRKLAEGSAKAAQEIAKLIKDIQKETGQSVNNMEESSRGAAIVKEMSGKVGESLNLIIKNTESVAVMIEQVSASSQQQAAGTKQVSKAVTDIAAVAEETASATEEASASTEQMTASMEEMAASAQELADMGITLRDMVAKFKIGDSQSTDSRVQSIEKKAELSRIGKLKEHAQAMRNRFTELRKKRTDADKEKKA